MDNRIYIVSDTSLLMDYLIKTFPDYNRKKIKGYLSNGGVVVNGKIVTKYNHELKRGDEIILDKYGCYLYLEENKIKLLYEDNDFVVINKPCKMLSAPAESSPRSAYDIMLNYVKLRNKADNIFILHRLDRDTSGVLVFTKSIKLRDKMQDNWDNYVKARKYIAVVNPKMEKKHDRLIDYLQENSEYMVYVTNKSDDAKEAITNYKVIKENEKYSLLDISLETGRKNQIRVQLSSRGNIIIGDSKYGSKINPLKRMLLHAYQISFIHPITNKTITIETKIPNIFYALF